jgi:hypothetical protein
MLQHLSVIYLTDNQSSHTACFSALALYCQAAVCRLITLARSLGGVVIITNAEAGWVELSAKKFFK